MKSIGHQLLQNNLEDLYSLLCFLHVEPWCNWAWYDNMLQLFAILLQLLQLLLQSGNLVGMLAYGITNIVLSVTRWSKLIQRPYESGDPRGLRLIKAILRSLMLRRTKETKDKKGR